MLKISYNVLYRERRYSCKGTWYSWFEPCPVVHETPKYVVVKSINYPESPLYPGGEFHVNKKQLQEKGKAYHSRHREYFFVAPLNVGNLPFNQDVLETPDLVTLEAKAMGWNTDVPAYKWEEWQRDCFLLATVLKIPLKIVVVYQFEVGELPELWKQFRRL